MDSSARDRKSEPSFSGLLIPSIALIVLGWLVVQHHHQVKAGELDAAAVLVVWQEKILLASLWMAGFLFLYRLTGVIILEWLVRRTLRRAVPRILHDVLGLVFATVAIMVAVQILFTQAFSSLLTLSGIFGIVIGLALRPIILDAFSGLSANMEAAFQIGDFVTVHDRNGTYTGWVDQINWRTTNIRTREGNLIVCPNSTFSTSVVTNYSRPYQLSRYEVRVKLPPEYPVGQGTEILYQAVEATLGKPGGPTGEKGPDVLIAAATDCGVEYRVRFWLDPVRESPDRATHLVYESILRNLRFAGIRLAAEREEVSLLRASRSIADYTQEVDRVQFLASLPLFAGIQKELLEILAGRLEIKSFEAGQRLVEEGGKSSEMYVLVQGVLRITKQEGTTLVELTRMQAGDYFGEMALLTGEERTATVTSLTPCKVFEISRPVMQDLLKEAPEVMQLLSRNLAERKDQMEKALRRATAGPTQTRETWTEIILHRMKALFRLTRAPFSAADTFGAGPGESPRPGEGTAAVPAGSGRTRDG